MATATRRRDPLLHWGGPIWCHHHGIKMYLENLDLENHVLVISGSAAKVTIRKASLVYPDAKGWLVDWEVIQYTHFKEGARGRSRFSDEDLKAAFGLSESSGTYGDWLIQQFGADAAEQGKYIRWKDFLNIPCPGTGSDGDPNVSIHLDQKIQNAVRKLLQ